MLVEYMTDPDMCHLGSCPDLHEMYNQYQSASGGCPLYSHTYGQHTEVTYKHTYGQHTEAIAWFTRTIETDPAYCYAWYHKAKCEDTSGDPIAATKTLQDGIEHATACGDTHAAQEMGELLEQIT